MPCILLAWAILLVGHASSLADDALPLRFKIVTSTNLESETECAAVARRAGRVLLAGSDGAIRSIGLEGDKLITGTMFRDEELGARVSVMKASGDGKLLALCGYAQGWDSQKHRVEKTIRFYERDEPIWRDKLRQTLGSQNPAIALDERRKLLWMAHGAPWDQSAAESVNGSRGDQRFGVASCIRIDRPKDKRSFPITGLFFNSIAIAPSGSPQVAVAGEGFLWLLEGDPFDQPSITPLVREESADVQVAVFSRDGSRLFAYLREKKKRSVGHLIGFDLRTRGITHFSPLPHDSFDLEMSDDGKTILMTGFREPLKSERSPTNGSPFVAVYDVEQRKVVSELLLEAQPVESGFLSKGKHIAVVLSKKLTVYTLVPNESPTEN